MSQEKRVVRCTICGEAHITTGKDDFKHCGKKQPINEVKFIETTEIIDFFNETNKLKNYNDD